MPKSIPIALPDIAGDRFWWAEGGERKMGWIENLSDLYTRRRGAEPGLGGRWVRDSNFLEGAGTFGMLLRGKTRQLDVARSGAGPG